jgi:putative glutathione S-transferase
MASLVNGQFSDEPVAKTSRSGSFERAQTTFRGAVSESEARAGRYHLYVSYACPWAHRTLIARKLKHLENVISVSVTDAHMGEKGWTFSKKSEPRYLAVVYLAADRKFTGKITVPVLWDTEKKNIVNNESADILRIINSSFNHLTTSDIDLYPEELRAEIDRINERIYENVNNGVYKAGFASTQKAYDEAVACVFEVLDEMDKLLGERPYLAGKYLTEADVRFFTTLVRFDAVYYSHFKCNLKRIKDYANLYPYLRALYQIPEIKETVHFDHIKKHYYTSHKWINPSGIIPQGPIQDLDEPHSRGEAQFFHRTH